MATAPQARAVDHDDTVALQPTTKPAGCIGPVTACVTAVVGVVLATVAIVLSTGILNRPSSLLSSSPVPPAGFKRVGALHAGEGEWVRKRRMPSAMSDMQAVTIGDTILVLGGLVASGPGGAGTKSPVANVTAFDSVFETFHAAAAPPLPTPLYRFGAAAITTLPAKTPATGPSPPSASVVAFKAAVLAAGGITTTNGLSTDAAHVLTVDVDPAVPARATVVKALASASWSPAPALPVALSDFAVAAVTGGFVAVGGYDSVFNAQRAAYFLSVDPATGSVGSSWTSLPDMGAPRGDIAAVSDASGGHVMVLGGWGGSGSDLAFRATVEAYDAAARKWTTLSSLPFARGDKAAALVHGHVVAVGGEITSGLRGPCAYDPSQTCDVNEVPVHDVEAMAFGYGASAAGGRDTDADTPWVPRAPYPSARFRFAAASAHGVLYTFGGHGLGADGDPAATLSSEVWALFQVATPDIYLHQAA